MKLKKYVSKFEEARQYDINQITQYIYGYVRGSCSDEDLNIMIKNIIDELIITKGTWGYDEILFHIDNSIDEVDTRKDSEELAFELMDIARNYIKTR